jgi:hypothetical protein
MTVRLFFLTFAPRFIEGIQSLPALPNRFNGLSSWAPLVRRADNNGKTVETVQDWWASLTPRLIEGLIIKRGEAELFALLTLLC